MCFFDKHLPNADAECMFDMYIKCISDMQAPREQEMPLGKCENARGNLPETTKWLLKCSLDALGKQSPA